MVPVLQEKRFGQCFIPRFLFILFLSFGGAGGLGVWGLGLGAWGLGFGVWGLGLGAWGFGSGFWGLGLRVWDLGFRASGASLAFSQEGGTCVGLLVYWLLHVLTSREGCGEHKGP